ncbi:MAG: hypothetical protein JXQ30_11235 [Spirochaetes bacterium]|nr:hypothetical protein [Spirochaetota bacterium]
MDRKTLKSAAIGLLNNMKTSLPLLLGVLLIIALINNAIPPEFYARIFTGKRLIDPVVGALVGSIAAGNPLTSYIIGGELLQQGVGMLAVVAFILAWVTVGVVQLPAESIMLGKRFALVRNGVSYLFAVIIALLTVLTLETL